MNRRTATLGLCMLCALAVSALAAQGAGAVTTGTTAFTCKDTGSPTGTFTKAHCKSSDAGEGNYSHVAVAQNTTTEVVITNEGVGPETNEHRQLTFKMVISGVETEFSATKVHGIGSLENKIDPGTGEHYLHGEAELDFTEMKVTKPAEKGCIVYGDAALTEKEVIHLDPVTFTSTGQNDSLKFTPVGARFATFWIGGCSIAALNGEYPLTGSLTGTPDGATMKFTHAKTTETLKIKNAFTKAGIEGELTVKGRDDPEETFTPLSVTTVETA